MSNFIDKERVKFEQWYITYGNHNLCKEAQWHGFLGRAQLASKSQNDPSKKKMYRITYLDSHGNQTYKHEMAASPKEAMADLEKLYPQATALYANDQLEKESSVEEYNKQQLTVALDLIREHYGDKVAERSRVPLINHINEGLVILQELGASYAIMAAYCLHPLLQDDLELSNNYHRVSNLCDIVVVGLAMQYRRAANAYLCRPETDDFTLDKIRSRVGVHRLSQHVKMMLIADKQQNQKDFLKYHQATHPRSEELTQYFKNWLEILR